MSQQNCHAASRSPRTFESPLGTENVGGLGDTWQRNLELGPSLYGDI